MAQPIGAPACAGSVKAGSAATPGDGPAAGRNAAMTVHRLYAPMTPSITLACHAWNPTVRPSSESTPTIAAFSQISTRISRSCTTSGRMSAHMPSTSAMLQMLAPTMLAVEAEKAARRAFAEDRSAAAI